MILQDDRLVPKIRRTRIPRNVYFPRLGDEKGPSSDRRQSPEKGGPVGGGRVIDMDTTVSSTLIAAVPPEDEAIASTLAELDQQLDAWARAVEEVQAALGEAASQVAADPAGAAAKSPPSAESKATVAPAGTEVTSERLASAVASDGLRTEPVASVEEVAAQTKQSAARADAAAKASAAEDERLLASLDPKKAKAIRIRRRLSNNSKSVHELLAEEGWI